MDFPGNPLRVRLAIPVEQFLRRVGEEGLGHHWMAVYGDFRAELGYFCELAGIRRVHLC